MVQSSKKKSKSGTKEFVPMRRTRAMLNEVWNHLITTFEHTPDTAKRMMTTAVKEMHKTEKAARKKISAKKSAAKKSVKKTVVKKAKKLTAKIKK